MLIHEVIAKNLLQMAASNFDQAGNKRRAKLTRDIMNYHTSPLEAAAIAAAAKAETLVFTHKFLRQTVRRSNRRSCAA